MTSPIIQTDRRPIVLDLSNGAELCGQPIAGLDVRALSKLIERTMAAAGTSFAFGRWAEPRELYTSNNFAGEGNAEARTVHMGIDLFCAAGTPVHAPLDGVVVILANNDGELDYGPLLVLEHSDGNGACYHTLFGHLSLGTLERVTVGQKVEAGERIASVGEPPSNGNWPPHLHFQLINDLLGLGKDFPGVAPKGKQDYWLAFSPSPARFFPEIAPERLEYT